MSECLECPVCQEKNSEVFLERDQVPANQNLVIASFSKALNISKGKLSLHKCRFCGFVFNGAFDPSLLQYGEFYDNTQDQSPLFQRHLAALVAELIEKKGFQNHQIIEIGCGKGRFLESLITHPLSKNRGIGFDPTYLGNLDLYEGRLKFEKRFYNETCSQVKTDVIICRHVIEHIPNPVQFLKIIKNALLKSPDARLFFETPCLNWILENNVIWDFFYEHCSYFTSESLSFAFEQAGFQVEQVRHVFGSQYLWLEASLGSRRKRPSPANEFLGSINRYLAAESELKRNWEEKIQKLLKLGKIAIWGAGAKGVTFANLFDPNREFFECVVDINPRKQNHFLPGTGHRIIGVEKLKEYRIANAILMNPNYLQENQKLLKEYSSSIHLVCL